MGLISKVITGFFNGMSQQPPALRLDSQCEEEINGLSSLVDGTTKRPPTEHVATLTTKAATGSFVHTINRDSQERYTTVFTGDATEPIEIFTKAGVKCTVRYGSLNEDNVYTADTKYKSYVNSFVDTTPQESLKATTVADYTLVVNKNIIGSMKAPIATFPTNRGIVSIKSGVAETTYTIYINGVVFSTYKTGVSTDSLSYRADTIATKLVANAGIPNTSTYNGDGVTKTFAAQGTTGINVTLNGVAQTLGLHYTVSGNLVTFVTAPTKGTQLYVGGQSLVSTGATIYSVTPIPTGGIILVNGVAKTEGVDYTKVYVPEYSTGTPSRDNYVLHPAQDVVTFINIPPVGATLVFGSVPQGAFITNPQVVVITSVGSSAYVCTQNNSSILITKTDGTTFTLTTFDSWQNQAMIGIQRTVQKFTDLPYYGFQGYPVEITGDPGTKFDNYFVKYDAALQVWAETVEDGLSNIMEPQSLPHRLVRTGVNEFTFAPIIWRDRLVGNNNTNPLPSFIGKSISDIFFYKNRLGVLAGENICLSRSGDFFNFFSQTTTSTLDDDPIDIATSTNEVATLFHAQPFNSQLVVFSDQMQFIINSNQQSFTAKTAAIDMSTHFATDRNCKPVSAGANIFFVSPKGNNTSIKEYFVQANTLTNDAADVTAHVPRLLPANPIKIVSSSAMDTLFVLCKDTPTKLYVYKYYWSGDTKAQSSWSVWEFTDEILNVDFLDTNLQLLMKRGNNVCLETLQMNKSNTGSLPFRVHLDRQCLVQGVYEPENNRTLWTYPYAENTFDLYKMAVNSHTGMTLPSISVEINYGLGVGDLPVALYVYAAGDQSAYPYYLGRNYTHSYQFSEWFLKAPNSNVGSLQGRLQMRSLTLNYTNTGYFKVEVTPFNRDTISHEYNASIVGQTLLGQPSIVSETRKFPLMSNAQGTTVKLVNDTYLPSEFHSASFEGYYTSRNQPV